MEMNAMTSSDPKQVARDFWDHMGHLRFGDAQALLAPDSIFAARAMSAPLTNYFPVISAIFECAPIRHFDIRTFAEGSEVAYVAKGDCTLPDGSAYQNHYVFMMTVRDGKIYSITEYSDSAYAFSVLIPALPESLRLKLGVTI
jgi:ketosteroid isomerase-like protein